MPPRLSLSLMTLQELWWCAAKMHVAQCGVRLHAVWCGVQLLHVMQGCVGLGFAVAWVDRVEVGHHLNK